MLEFNSNLRWSRYNDAVIFVLDANTRQSHRILSSHVSTKWKLSGWFETIKVKDWYGVAEDHILRPGTMIEIEYRHSIKRHRLINDGGWLRIENIS